MVPETGIEPVRMQYAGDFKSPVSTNFTTRAGGMEARVGIEPAYTELQSAA